jgi:cytochrome c-type biogenesis protein CcmE
MPIVRRNKRQLFILVGALLGIVVYFELFLIFLEQTFILFLLIEEGIK